MTKKCNVLYCSVVDPVKTEKLHQAALLKIAMKMRKADQNQGFEELFQKILVDMDLDEEEFRSYLNTHMQSLIATVKQRGYSR